MEHPGQRLVRIGAVLMVVVALAVAIGVMPAVAADTHPDAMPQRALTGFAVHIGINLLAAAAIRMVTMRAAARRALRATVLGLGSVVAVLLAVALTDAGAAFLGHGPAMRAASVLLLACAAVELVAAVLVIVAAVKR